MKKITTFLLLHLCYMNVMAQIRFERHLNDIGSIANFINMDFAISADMDADGDQDVISYLEAEERLVWFENLDGAGTFNRIQHLITDEGVYGVALAEDLNNDGNIDIIIRSKSSYKFLWLENSGSKVGNWDNRHVIDANQNSGISSASAYDLDGDGDLDLISRGSAQRFGIYENTDGIGTFVNIPGFVHGANPGASGIIDIDGDNNLDIVIVYDETNEIGWFNNIDGSNNFGNFSLIEASIPGASGMAIADINGDNLDDIVTRSTTSKKILWLENIGNGDFNSPKLILDYEIPDLKFQLSDMDSNGTIDIVYSSYLDGDIGWLVNMGSGVFNEPQNDFSHDLKKPTFFDIADFNGDGKNDILATSEVEGRTAWFDLYEPSFNNNYPVYSDIFGSSSVQAVDMDNDGDADIISINYAEDKLFWRDNTDGSGNEFSFNNIAEIEGLSSISAADLNGNQRKDILYTSLTKDYVRYRTNFNSLKFSSVRNVTTDLNGATAAKAKDLDGDGDNDVVAVGYYSNNVYWYENDGNGFFNDKHELIASFPGGNEVYIDDLNNDNRPDIILASPITHSIIWFENSGNGFAAAKIITDQVTDITSLYVKDLDGDGLKDIVFGALGKVSLGWLKNINQATSFSEINNIAYKTFVRDVTIGDVDGDSDYDVVVSSLRSNALIWYENIDGSGNNFRIRNLGGAQETTSVVPVDIDNDLDIDFVSGALYSTSTPWYENLGRSSNKITGMLSLDLGNNGCNMNNLPMPSTMITTSNESNSFSTFTDTSGLYNLEVSRGDFTTAVTRNFKGLYSVQPTSYSSQFTSDGNLQVADFCIVSEQSKNDLSVEIFPLTAASPGFEAEYLISYRNVGNTILDGLIEFNFDSTKLNFINSSITPFTQNEDYLTYNFSNLNPFETRNIHITLKLKVPPTNEIGNELVFETIVNPVTNDITPENNTFNLTELVIGSFDPNDIQVLEGSNMFIGDAHKDLHYIIRFQNTGTAPAISVKISNVLDANLNWKTMQLVKTSHPSTVEIIDGNRINFYFEQINLPDSTTNEPESHGYIIYKIKPIDDIEVGDIVFNEADIFFDFNLPINTNTVATTYVDVLNTKEFSNNDLKLYPVPAKNKIFIENAQPIKKVKVYNAIGQLCMEKNDIKGVGQLDISSLSKGVYILRLIDETLIESTKLIVKN